MAQVRKGCRGAMSHLFLTGLDWGRCRTYRTSGIKPGLIYRRDSRVREVAETGGNMMKAIGNNILISTYRNAKIWGVWNLSGNFLFELGWFSIYVKRGNRG